MAITYKVIDSLGVIHTRTSRRHTAPVYTHAVCAVPGSNKKNTVSYCGSHALAVKQLAYWHKCGDSYAKAEIRIVAAYDA